MVVIYMLPGEKMKMSAESFDFAILDGCHFYASERYCTIYQCGYPALRAKDGGPVDWNQISTCQDVLQLVLILFHLVLSSVFFLH